MKKIATVGVIGHRGMVGGTVYKYFVDKKYLTYGYSKTEQGEKDFVNSSDIVFVCVPTPYHWDTHSFNGSIVDAALTDIAGGRIVVIKSTVPIGTTEKLQQQYPTLKLLFNPEFLSENTAEADFINPDRQFLGYTAKSKSVAEEVMRLLPLSSFELLCPSREAELLKYINNLHGMLEVMEANHYYDVCQKEGLDYDRIKTAMVASKYMGKHYKEIFHKGYRGLGGKCFPKDLNTWLKYCDAHGIDRTLFGAVRMANIKYLEKQGITEEGSEQK